MKKSSTSGPSAEIQRADDEHFQVRRSGTCTVPGVVQSLVPATQAARSNALVHGTVTSPSSTLRNLPTRRRWSSAAHAKPGCSDPDRGLARIQGLGVSRYSCT